MKIVDSPGRLTSRLGGALALVSLLLTGCPGQSSTGTGHRGDELLEQVQKAYEQARSYADAGEADGGSDARTGRKTPLQTLPFSVSYAKPDKLRVEAYDVSVVCDGKHLWSAIADEHFGRPGVVSAGAGRDQSGRALPRATCWKGLLGGGEGWTSVAATGTVAGRSAARSGCSATTSRPNGLAKNPLRGEESLYHVVEVTGSRGTFVLWVDPKSYVLRRLEITDAKVLNPVREAPMTSCCFTIDFKGAELDGKIGENAFKFEAPATAKLVSQFVLPPAELDYPPSELLGQQPGAFKFVDSEGKPVDLASLDGRVVVFDMWAMSCQYCFESFPNLEKVYRQYRDNPKVAILTVNNIDVDGESSTGDASARPSPRRVSICRSCATRNAFRKASSRFQAGPTMIILGTDGTVQAYEIGYKADLAETLPKKIDQLLAGENLADQTLASYRRLRADFERHLAEATVGVNQEIELPRAKIAPRSEPDKLKLEKLWTTDDIKNPGNFIVFPNADGEQRIAVFDGWRSDRRTRRCRQNRCPTRARSAAKTGSRRNCGPRSTGKAGGRLPPSRSRSARSI